MTESLFWEYFGELINQLVVSANCQYFNFKLFNTCLEEVVRDVNVFGLNIYLRDCGKFKTRAVIFMGNDLRNCSKVFGDRTVFSIYLGIFEDYRVELLKQFTNINQFMHVCQ